MCSLMCRPRLAAVALAPSILSSLQPGDDVIVEQFLQRGRAGGSLVQRRNYGRGEAITVMCVDKAGGEYLYCLVATLSLSFYSSLNCACVSMCAETTAVLDPSPLTSLPCEASFLLVLQSATEGVH